MNERDRLIEQLIRERGGTREQYLHLLNTIAFHESAGTFDPKIKQRGGGPGRGKYQFEKGRAQGANTALNRTKAYYKELGFDVPKWIENASKNKDFDVSSLSEQQQDILFLSNMRKHPKADYRNLWEGKQTIPEFWANYHWAGPKRQRGKMQKRFASDMKRYNEITTAKPPTEEEARALPEQPKDGVNIKQPAVLDQLVKQYGGDNSFSLGGLIRERNLNSFNAGGRHESNPHGGVPQGMGANGKMNTVEQGEASFKFKDGKFIFSDRINVMAEGGPTDPPSKKAVVESNKQWVKDWFSAPETLARYSMNTGQGFSKSVPDLMGALENIDATTYRFDAPTDNKNSGAQFAHGNIDFYKDPTDQNTTHELVHATKLDDKLSRVIKDQWGHPASAIQKKTGKDFTGAIEEVFDIKGGNFFGDSSIESVKKHSRYMSEPGELYPRIMEMRRAINAKPGQIIKDADIQKIKKSLTNDDMFKFYTDEQIKEMLNTLAANKSKQNYDNLV